MKTQKKGKQTKKIGIISDTHGLLRPEAVNALQGSDIILHAGDIGDIRIIDELEMIAPVVAVRGNMDNDYRTLKFRRTETCECGGHLLYLLHDVSRLDLDPAAAKIKAVVFGHSHRPSVQKHKGVLYLNPGSAGPRRFRLPVTVAVLTVTGSRVSAEIIKLKA